MRRIIALGIALLVLAPAGSVGLYLGGAAFHVAEPPVQETISLGTYYGLPLCNGSELSTDGLPCSQAPDLYPSLQAAVPGTDVRVVAAQDGGDNTGGPGMVFTITQNGSRVLAGAALGCDPDGLAYPGEGPVALVECVSYPSGNFTFLTYDFASGSIDHRVAFGTNTTRCYDPAFGRAPGTVVCYGSTSRLDFLTWDLASGSLLSNVSGPTWTTSAHFRLWWDPVQFRYLAVVLNDSSVYALDPTTGVSTAGAVVGGYALGTGFDPSTDRLFLSTTPTTPPFEGPVPWKPGELAVVNSTSLGVEDTVPLGRPASSQSYIVADDRRGDVWVPSFWGLEVIHLATRTSVANLTTFYGFSGPMALDPGSGRVLQLSYGLDPEPLGVQQLVYGNTSAPPFTTVPLVGSALPWVLGAIGVLAGSVILLREVALERRRRDRGVPADVMRTWR